jgi:HD-GYP domain-containing protein (c-di-GMP phosphodiesterase class II)/HAMP domain-containing protein
MKIGNIKPERTFLRNKVAQQLFLMFILCALVPLAAMTVISYVRVNGQLNDLADERLHEACKAAGMNLVERLSFLESDLDLFIAVNSGRTAGKSRTASREIVARLSQRYRWISLRSNSGQIIAQFGTASRSMNLSPEEIEHLSSGKTLVTTRENQDRSQEVFVAKMYTLEEESGALLLGEVHPDYLWESDSVAYSSAEIFIVNKAMKTLYSTLREGNPLRELEAAVRKNPSSGRLEWAAGKDQFIANYWTVFMQPSFKDNWIVVYSEKREAVLESVGSFQRTFYLIALLMFWVAAFLSMVFIQRRMKPVEQLCEETRRIAAKDFKARVNISSRDEFGELGTAFNAMAQSLGSYFDTIQTTNRIGISLSAESDEKKLLGMILKGAKTLINADGAMLYLLSENQQMTVGLMQIDSLGIMNQCGDSPEEKGNESFPGSAETTAFLGFNTVCCTDIYSVDGDRFLFQKEFDRRNGYRTRSLLSVPLTNHEGERIGVLQLLNAKDRHDGSIISFSEEDARLAESLASQAAVALSKNHLMTELILLFEGLTELVATAVDAKSPHTADHCKRVPALTMMIAEAACRAKEGPFKDFTLSADECYELKIAALLHDCGKVATPVHIIEKATKLQSIQDRIELIDSRFEILRRDKLIELYRNKIEALLGDDCSSQLSAVDQEWQEFSQRLDDDLKFLRKCNAGRERITAVAKKRILDIALEYSWINRNQENKPILTDDETENLSIAEGTLTERERTIVNEHVNLTIRMLQALPLPKKLRNLPVYAGAHHERMDGSGYPQGLSREQIAIQGRIITLADVFEALTAADRPYKPARNVMDAVEILKSMKDKGQIDSDLFELFVKEKLHLLYAEHFLNPSWSGDSKSN